MVTLTSEQNPILEITALSRGGSGICRDSSGRVIFVPFTVPGDRIHVQITQKEKNYSHGTLTTLVEPSPLRATPRCSIFGICGGCQWQHVPYDLQWKTKYLGTLHALERAGILPQAIPIEQIPAQRIWEYRNRIQLRGNSTQLGFFKRKSREIVSTDRCDIARPEINASWSETQAEGKKQALSGMFKVEVEVSPDAKKVIRSWNDVHAAQGFRQVHDDQNALMQQWVYQKLKEIFPQETKLYDLFGGNGNLSLGLASYFQEIHCIDLSSPLQSTLQPPPQHSEKHSYSFHRSAVLPWILRESQQKQKNPAPAAAILDPPREGLGHTLKEISFALKKLHVSHVIVIGCDPDAWVKDLAGWNKSGWKIQQFMFIDFFPQTTHIESIALLAQN